MKLSGIEISNFRSIGSDFVDLAPLKKSNIIIGRNNAGKSNVLRAVQLVSQLRSLATYRRSEELPGIATPTLLDVHKGDTSKPITLRLHFDGPDSSNANETALVAAVGTHFEFTLTWQIDQEARITDSSFAKITVFGKANKLLADIFAESWTQFVSVETFQKRLKEKSDLLFRNFFVPAIPIVHLVPEFRRIQAGEKYEMSGTNLIGLLFSYQNPEFGEDANRSKFDLIQSYVRRLLNLPNAELSVTSQTQTIMLTDNGYRLPLASWGTGVHQFVILVTAVLSVENCIICIEEPEIHLHPGLQRAFIEFLTKETKNTYIFSTHSSALINLAGTEFSAVKESIQLFHLRRTDNGTTGSAVLRDAQSLEALNDLGVDASDILQSNCILWVEGPSDRVYINHWLNLVAPELVEGLL